ncbi:LPP20 family lipoprotein [Gallaecimonas mangrovi]|uniref:LPP20 family lipoprotein n=1 Tax=Gallaecimonas mangrovi TaxID=2291597 RepID=UPI000E20A6B9|nr:LPP20 family lipoprotein [Gallaecimonas mangrovi]
MRTLIIMLILSVLAGCSSEQLIRYQLKTPEKTHLLKATGYAPIDSQVGPTYEEKLIQAQQASRLDAYRRLAEQLYGQQIRSQSKVNGSTVNRQVLESKVQGVVRGATLVANYIEGKFYTTKLELNTADLTTLGTVESEEVDSETKWWY